MWRKRLCVILALAVASVGVEFAPATGNIPLLEGGHAWAGPPASPPAAVNPSAAVVVVSAAGPTVAPGQIGTDTVWGPLGSPYVVSGQLDVPVGVSLTLLPGTVVKLGPGATVQVHGALLALGTPRQRVVFTSVRDDAVGGDSNGDGAASVPAVGDWAQIVVRGGSAAGSDAQRPVSVLDYAEVRYGGYGSSCGLGAAVWAAEDATRLVVSNSSFTNVRGGVRVGTKRDRYGFTGIYNSTFSVIDGCAVMSDDASAEIVGNTFEASVGTAWYSFLPRGERFWFNTAGAVLSFPSATPLPADAVDLRYNALLRGVSGPVPDISRNWWGADINLLPPCMDPAVAAAANPPITTVGSSSCPPGQAATAGFVQPVTPALSASPTVLPAAAREAMAPRYGPVNTHAGTLALTRTDLSVPDAGSALVATRVYRSDVTSGADAGPGWSVSYSEGLSAGGGVASMTLPDGRSLGFLTDPAAGYVPAPGVAASFSSDAGGTTITAPDQTGYRFDAAGELTQMVLGDPGHTATVTRSGGRPARVTGTSGRYLDFQRTGGLVTAITDSAGRSVGLSYAAGRLASVTGVDGHAETYAYDGQGRLTTVTSPTGRVRLAVGYDGANRVAWLERQGVGRVSFAYDTANGRTVIGQPDGGQVWQEYDFAGRLVAEQTEAGSGAVGGSGRHVVYNGEGHLVVDIAGVPNVPLSGYGPAASATLYDGSGDAVLTVDPVGGFVHATFDARHRPMVVTQPVTATSTGQTIRTYTPEGRLSTLVDPVGKLWRFTANARGQVTGRTDPLGRQVGIAYAGNGDASSRTDETGAVTGFEYDPAGRLTATVSPLGHRVEATYTPWDAPATHTRATGGVTVVVYDEDRQPVSVTDPVGGVTRVEYDPAGRPSAVVDAVGGRSTVAYDTMGRTTAVTRLGPASTTWTFSAEGWPISQTDAAGAATATSYDPAGRPVRVTDALGQVVQTVYTRAGQVARVQTPDGAIRGYAYDAAGHAIAYFGAGPATDDTWTASYDPAGRVSVVADPLGHQRRTSYDDAGRVATTTDPMGVVATYAYSDTERAVAVTDPLGPMSVQTRDAAGRIVGDADPTGAVTGYGYDADGQVTTITDPDGVVTGYEYDPAGRLTATVDPAGRRTSYTLDRLGRVTGRDLPGPGSDSWHYDPAGNPTSYTDPTEHEWTATFDAMGRVLTETDPLGHTITFDRDPLGRVVSTADPTGVVTTVGYDPVGRVAVAADSTGASWRTGYDGEGHMTSTVDPLGVTWTYTLDKAGRLTDAVSDAGARHYTFTYDAADRLAASDAPYHVSYGYDARGDRISRTDALGRTTRFGYDGAGRETTVTLPSGHATTTIYTPGGRVASATDANGSTSTYGYDGAGQLGRVTLPRGGHYDYTYNDAGLIAAESDPLGRTTTHGYDPAGRPVSTLYPSGRLIESGYDDAGRLITSTAGGEVRRYGYDNASRLVLATSPTGVLGFGYDTRGLLVRSTDARGDTSFEYDAAHRLTRRTPAAGAPTVYGYDLESGEVATVRGPMNLDLDRGPGGRINRLRGIAPSSTAVKETYNYNVAGQLTSTTAGATPASQVTYDIDGQVATHAQNHGTDPANNTTDLGYDNAGRLTTAVLKHGTTVISTTTYGWDADGNRTSLATTGQPALTTTYDLADRPTASSDGTTYTHDLDGNLTSTVKAGAATTFTYNAFDELVETSTAGVTVAYTRDPLGRVTRRTQTGAADRYTFYDGTTTLVGGVRTGTGPISDAIRLPDNGKLLALAGPGTNTLRIQSTVHGDVSGLWNGTTGAALAATTYDPFGVPTTSGTDPIGLGWQTMPTDPTNGLVDMAFRHYQPTTGRFTAPDNLIGEPTQPITLNRYLYANASPANYVDPDGHSALVGWKDGGIGAAGAGAIAASGIALTIPDVVPAIRSAIASIRIPCPLVCSGTTARTELAVKPISAAGAGAAATAQALAALGDITDLEIDSINCLKAALLPWTKECGGSGVRPGGGGGGGTGGGGAGGGGSSPWTGLPRPPATVGSGHVISTAIAATAAAAVANATADDAPNAQAAIGAAATAAATAVAGKPGGCGDPREIISEIAQATVDGAQNIYDLMAGTDHTYYVSAGDAPGLVNSCAPGKTGGGPGIWTPRNESMSPRAAAYQEQITGCPCGNAYNVNGVAFDGFRGGTLLDAKGPGYGSFVNRTTGRFHDWYEGADSLVDQAQRQLAAAGATPITWHVAEQNAAAAMQSLLGGRGVIGINIVWTPFG